MKKNIALMLTLLVTGSTLFFTGCKKDDKDEVPPVVSVSGPNPDYVQRGSAASYADPGATASDNIDGTLTANASGNVNMSTVGTYTITYTATDREGNVGTATRIVYVVDFSGRQYDVVDNVTGGPGAGTWDYNVDVNPSTTNPKRIRMNNFGGFGTAVTVNVDFNGSNLTIPSQPLTGAPLGFEGTVTGSGTMSGSNAQTMNINYVIDYDNAAFNNDNGSATFTLQ
jgi:hypothetical protein